MSNGAADISLSMLSRMMVALGVKQLLVKELADNDNSKNQVYLGGNLGILNILPMGEVREETTPAGRAGLKAPMPFYWLLVDGSIVEARHTQIILYPQYPEIRLSGFLRGAYGAPNELMTIRQAGRLLFFGITEDRRTVGWAASPDSRLAAEVGALGQLQRTGIFQHIPLGTADTSRELLLQKLRSIHESGWLQSQRFHADGTVGLCKGTNCGGYTLEAQFGIVPNGKAEPDFEGWEIKGHVVATFNSAPTGQLTLMTPEPTGGIYKEQGPAAFVRQFGYADQSGVPDRINFSSPHRYGLKNPLTGLTLKFLGYDPGCNRITDPKGGFALTDEKGQEAATWHFAQLIQHWNKKHAKAAYVPYMSRTALRQEYSYGDRVRLGEDTNFLRFLKAMGDRKVYYDPGIKVENASTPYPNIKRRSQFRIRSVELNALYERFQTIRLVEN